MTFSLSYCRKELLLSCCRHARSNSDGNTWQKVTLICGYKVITKLQNRIYFSRRGPRSLAEEDPGPFQCVRWISFRRNLNNFQGLNISEKSSILCVLGAPQPTSAIVLSKKKPFIWLRQKCKMLWKYYYSRSRSRTPGNSKDGVICNNSFNSSN